MKRNGLERSARNMRAWRESRREELMPDDPRRDVVTMAPGEHPEEEAILADSIGVALLILLDALPTAANRGRCGCMQARCALRSALR